MSSSKQGLTTNNIIIDIPPEHIENGKTLLIERYFELFVDGYHLSKQAHFIKHIHQLCLIDTQQQQNKRSTTSNHQSESTNDDNVLVQLIIEIPSESLNLGKSIRIEKLNSNGNSSGNLDDLYNISSENKQIDIQIPGESLQRGKTILIQKDKILIIKTDDYQKEQTHHLTNNQFAKKDHLVSKKMMEITIELPPEFFDDGQLITITKEDPHLIEANFPYHRQSKPDPHTVNIQ